MKSSALVEYIYYALCAGKKELSEASCRALLAARDQIEAEAEDEKQKALEQFKVCLELVKQLDVTFTTKKLAAKVLEKTQDVKEKAAEELAPLPPWETSVVPQNDDALVEDAHVLSRIHKALKEGLSNGNLVTDVSSLVALIECKKLGMVIFDEKLYGGGNLLISQLCESKAIPFLVVDFARGDTSADWNLKCSNSSSLSLPNLKDFRVFLESAAAWYTLSAC